MRIEPFAVCAMSGGALIRSGRAERRGLVLIPKAALSFELANMVRVKWTRQRCQVAINTLATAALIPTWASEITGLTPRRPRRASLRRGRPARIPWL